MGKYHLGQEIKKEVERQKMRTSYLANKLCYNRANVYNIYKRETMDIGLLITISKVLHRNFLEEIAKQIEV